MAVKLTDSSNSSINEDGSALIPTVVSGRPQMNFENSSSKRKKRRSAPLVASFHLQNYCLHQVVVCAKTVEKKTLKLFHNYQNKIFLLYLIHQKKL